MTDMIDVVNFLNRALGPYHELTLAANSAANPTSPLIDISSDESQIILWCLARMARIIEQAGSHIDWNYDTLPSQLNHYIFTLFGLSDVVDIFHLRDKYPDESTELQELGITIENMINDPNIMKELTKNIYNS